MMRAQEQALTVGHFIQRGRPQRCSSEIETALRLIVPGGECPACLRVAGEIYLLQNRLNRAGGQNFLRPDSLALNETAAQHFMVLRQQAKRLVQALRLEPPQGAKQHSLVKLRRSAVCREKELLNR